MNYISTLIILIFLSCRDKMNDSIEGKWQHRDEYSRIVSEIIFKNGVFEKRVCNKLVISKCKGKYYLNENESRKTVTLSLIPDLIYSSYDTIILPCQNLDILNLTNNNFKVQITIDSSVNYKKIK